MEDALAKLKKAGLSQSDLEKMANAGLFNNIDQLAETLCAISKDDLKCLAVIFSKIPNIAAAIEIVRAAVRNSLDPRAMQHACEAANQFKDPAEFATALKSFKKNSRPAA